MFSLVGDYNQFCRKALHIYLQATYFGRLQPSRDITVVLRHKRTRLVFDERRSVITPWHCS